MIMERLLFCRNKGKLKESEAAGRHCDNSTFISMLVRLFFFTTFCLSFCLCSFSFGLLLRGGDVTVYVRNINQSSLPTPFYSVLVPISVFIALSTVFHSINSPDNSLFSHCSSGLFMKVSFSPDIILCG